mmetsp:Transcript_6495/g.29302  ORF Transcript_6495/g.29302 Transcript_6495/m.29302 type:complete len:206 (+) Transcript_6495:858-1475(+)
MLVDARTIRSLRLHPRHVRLPHRQVRQVPLRLDFLFRGELECFVELCFSYGSSVVVDELEPRGVFAVEHLAGHGLERGGVASECLRRRSWIAVAADGPSHVRELEVASHANLEDGHAGAVEAVRHGGVSDRRHDRLVELHARPHLRKVLAVRVLDLRAPREVSARQRRGPRHAAGHRVIETQLCARDAGCPRVRDASRSASCARG